MMSEGAMTKERAREIRDAVEEFRRNPPPDVVERLRRAAEESHRLRCPTCRGE